MRVLYIYRHPDMGFSIGKVFRPIEEEMKKYAEVDSVYLPCPNYKPLSLWQNIKAARQTVRKKHYDIVHITGTEHYLLPFLRKENTVVTVHDLGFFTNTGGLTIRSVWKYFAFIKTLRYAKCCTFISDKSHKEALRYVSLKDGQHVTVVNPIGDDFQYVPKEINTDYPRILHMGTKPNKNLDNTILALKGMPCHLRIIGDVSASQKAHMGIYGIEYSSAKDISDDQVVMEYADADIINFPSFYEGFGMPIIEGQKVGRPVLTSEIAPMNDIAGGAAVLVNPADYKSIRNGYRTILANPDKYVKEGLKNVKRFSIGKIAKEYLEIYKRVLNGSK